MRVCALSLLTKKVKRLFVNIFCMLPCLFFLSVDARALGSPKENSLILSPFTYSSMDKVVQVYSGQSWLLVLWSIDCAPCRGELELLGRLRKEKADFNLVLITIDSIATKSDIAIFLQDSHLTGVENWAFSNINTQRLRHAIDPEWFGELPRAYFYRADGSRQGVSGKLSESELNRWLQSE